MRCVWACGAWCVRCGVCALSVEFGVVLRVDVRVRLLVCMFLSGFVWLFLLAAVLLVRMGVNLRACARVYMCVSVCICACVCVCMIQDRLKKQLNSILMTNKPSLKRGHHFLL